MKTTVGLAIEEAVIAEARALGIEISGVAEAAIARECKAERNRLWAEANSAALDAYAAEVERHGLPLAKYRTF